ncbi:hypothetical protein V5O48_005594 [Marasmius crinis-equi]|uniref:Uncharacterized protein n=1 Tax=Marasmius crinis-equi TaxID=585013 RepID=A0ABR3FM29_9AGAR
MAQVSSSSLSLVRELNDLLLYLDLPLTLRSPTDLTPSLSLALLESILQQRLPGIPNDVRGCRTEEARVICVKMVLGVLQTDILAGTEEQMNDSMDLTVVDPERLARGGKNEVVKIAKVLCWLGRKVMTTEQHVHIEKTPIHRRHSSSSSSPTASRTSQRSSTTPNPFSPLSRRRPATESDTSVQDLDISTILPHLSSFEDPPSHSQVQSRQRPRPQCIHEVPSPEVGMSLSTQENPFFMDNDDSSSSSILAPINMPPVRQHGFIAEVDEDAELESFETNQVLNKEMSSLTMRETNQRLMDLDFDLGEAGHARTITLLKERARLLYRIAKLQQEPSERKG